MVELFAEPSYRRLWASGLCVNVARWMDLLTLGWLTLQLTGSPFMVGLAAFARAAPLMVVGPFSGIVADRVPRGRILLAAQATEAVTALALACLFAGGLGSYGVLVALEVVFGLVWALDFPARRTALYTLLGATRVAQAVSLETGLDAARQDGGAAGRGPVPGARGLGRVLRPDGRRLRRRARRGQRSAPPAGRARRDGTELGHGEHARRVRAAWSMPTVRTVLLVTIAMNTLFFPYQHMLPVFARDVLAIGPAGLGALVAADGLGALVGALALASRRDARGHRALFGAAVLAAPVLLVALSGARGLPLCVLLLVVMGTAESAFATMQSTLVLLSAPERVRGAAMGILSACIGTQPLGTLAIGLLAAGIGAPRAFAVNAVAALLVIVPLTLPLVRRRASVPAGCSILDAETARARTPPAGSS